MRTTVINDQPERTQTFTDVFTPAFVFPKRAPGVVDESLTTLTAALSDELESAGLEAREAARAIRADRLLSDDGKAEKSKQVAAELLQRLPAIRQKERDDLQAYITRTEANLLAPQVRHRIPEGVDKDDWRAVESEIRRKLDGIDPLVRAGMYRDAAQRGDRQFMRAVELAPQAFRLVTDEQVTEAAELFAESQWPDDFRALQEGRSTLDTINHTLGRARQHFSKMLGVDVAASALPTIRHNGQSVTVE